jgi:hypothetical protein
VEVEFGSNDREVQPFVETVKIKKILNQRKRLFIVTLVTITTLKNTLSLKLLKMVKFAVSVETES